ncbi:MAG TPA: hypothetical protein VK636_15380 [Gemmatimonadaceae bacterium]|nr:hypothetical protein [Gemmatimonadaceae bacterium]
MSATVVGEVRVTSPRRVWVASAMTSITCLPSVDGHHIKDPLVWEHGCLRCKHIVVRGGNECGRLVYLVGGGLVNPRGDPLVILASVVVSEMRQMAEAKMDYAAALEYLGIRFLG